MNDKKKTYRIVGKTNGYIASRDPLFSGQERITLHKNLTLRKAQQTILDMFNERFDEDGSATSNWGIAVIKSKRGVFGAYPTSSDGTRHFDYDGRTFEIEEEDHGDE